MAAKARDSLGFTLVEVLITLTILSLVMLTGAYAYTFMAQNWQRNQVTHQRSVENFEDFTLLNKTARNTFPKLVRDDNSLGFYFLGREEGFTAVTRTSMQDPDYSAVYRLFSEFGEKGQLQLVYEEALIGGQGLLHPEQQLPFNFRRVLSEGFAAIQFEYFSWPSMQDRINASSDMQTDYEGPRWFDEFDGFAQGQHPLVIQVIIGEFIWPIEVDDISSDLISRGTGVDI